jgi:hypothetical protein
MCWGLMDALESDRCHPVLAAWSSCALPDVQRRQDFLLLCVDRFWGGEALQ